ncbi:MAG: response regulator [Candidatus Omnitrophota bacterium]
MIRKVLMIDDDLDFIDACRGFLEALNYDFQSESREEDALPKIQTFKPDLILLDVVMQKETSGFDIAQSIFNDAELKNIPVVFLTGYFKKARLTDKESELIRQWANVKGVLDKPIKPADLLKLVRRIDEEHQG